VLARLPGGWPCPSSAERITFLSGLLPGSIYGHLLWLQRIGMSAGCSYVLMLFINFAWYVCRVRGIVVPLDDILHYFSIGFTD